MHGRFLKNRLMQQQIIPVWLSSRTYSSFDSYNLTRCTYIKCIFHQQIIYITRKICCK